MSERVSLETAVIDWVREHSYSIRLELRPDEGCVGWGDEYYSLSQIAEGLGNAVTGAMRRAVGMHLDKGYLKAWWMGDAPNSRRVYALVYRCADLGGIYEDEKRWIAAAERVNVPLVFQAVYGRTWAIVPAYLMTEVLNEMYAVRS